jgi:hypothetical protein
MPSQGGMAGRLRKSEHWWPFWATVYLPSAKAIDSMQFAASPKVQLVTDRSTSH